MNTLCKLMRQVSASLSIMVKENGSIEGKGRREIKVAGDPQSRAEGRLKFLKILLWEFIAIVYILPTGRALSPLLSEEKPSDSGVFRVPMRLELSGLRGDSVSYTCVS